MDTPFISRAIIKTISHNEVALLFICGSFEDAKRLDSMLDDYSMSWNLKEEGTITFYVMSPAIGGYSFNSDFKDTSALDSVNTLSCAYQSETGRLEYLPTRRLISESLPKS